MTRMRPRFSFLDQQGSSYIQVIMASTAIAGMALVGLKLAKEQEATAKTVYNQYLATYLNQEIFDLLSRSNNCQLSLQGKSFGSGDIHYILEGKDSGEAVKRFQALSMAGSSQHEYFNENVAIEKYNLQANLSDTSETADLLISYKVGENSIQRSIPLSLQLKEGVIKDCKVLVINESTLSEGPWVIKNNKIHTDQRNIKFGSRPQFVGDGVALAAGVFLEEESDLSVCDSKLVGVVKNIRGLGLRYCLDGRWYPLGFQPYRFQKKKTYEQGINKTGSEVSYTKKHRFCFMSKVDKNTLSDGCQLNRRDKEIYSAYEVKAYSSAAATQVHCEVTCVD